jgi:hypothetical protein
MNKLNEREVSELLKSYFRSKGLEILGKFNAFDHPDDDTDERSFEIDLAIGPRGTKGDRTEQQRSDDQNLFEAHSAQIDSVVADLNSISLFPGSRTSIRSWSKQANPNPLVGIAIEIENDLSKYFLGSLLAAAITGRWGMVIIPERPDASRWISTLDRMMHKGAQSPIPSNIAIFSWSTLMERLNNG